MNDIPREKSATDLNTQPRCGYVAITGRPNVGKSTLLNNLIGQKISITSRKPQTTRHHLLGIRNAPGAQILYLDSPGMQSAPRNAIHRHMNREAVNVLSDADIVLFVIETSGWTPADENVFRYIDSLQDPTVFLVINKTDKLRDKQTLLSLIDNLEYKNRFSEIIPLSARTRGDVSKLEHTIISRLPTAAPEYPDDQITNRSSRFLAAEFIREKLMQLLGDEIPYKLAVTIDKFSETPRCTKISATIWTEQDSQKKIVVGRHGSVLKKVGEQARRDMERLFEHRVYLRTWVKVRHKWTSDERALKEFEYS
ncbi:MAG: GTPase Era [Thiotrichales bacterium]|nr:GTPase Era [Thiotrichales bacterium]